MKKSVIILMLFSLFLSCEKCEIYSVEGGAINVPISLKGDYVDVSTTPLTKGELLNKYYAFEIDSLNITVKKYPHGFDEYDTTYVHYAGGVYTDIKNIGVFLKTGCQYRIRCSIIEEMEDQLYTEDGYVYEPFAAPDYGCGNKAEIGNLFVYGGTKQVFAYNGCPYVRTVKNEKEFSAKVSRYYGELITERIDEDSKISLEMQRKNFGLHFLLTPPSEGLLKVYQTYTSPSFEYVLDNNSSSIDEQYVYALDLLNESKTLDIRIEWVKEDGEVVDLGLGKTKLQNKTMTTIKVDINDRVGDSDIDIKYDSEMSNQEIIIN